MHISSWFYGYLNAPWWAMVLFVLIMTHITMMGVSLYLHRHQSHRALDMHPILSHFFRFWLWFTTGMKTKEWVGVHRKHHAFSDQPGDPHSPVVEGLKNVFWQGTEYYRFAKKDQATLDKYGQGTPADFLEKYVYSAKFMRGKQGVAMLLLLDLFLFGVPGLAIWAIQMAWTPFFAAGVINGLGHAFGYRNFECSDYARNMLPWGILIAGEELHNNHHAYGTSAKLSVKWFEFDIGYMYLRLFESVGLVKIKRMAPSVALRKHGQELNLDTLKALVNNRIQVLAKYTKTVTLPTFRLERAKAKHAKHLHTQKLCAKVRRSLIRHENLLKDAERLRLQTVLAANERLQLIYHYRQELQKIWTQKTASHSELLSAVQTWCKEAEQTGIDVLQEFVAYLKRYQLKA